MGKASSRKRNKEPHPAGASSHDQPGKGGATAGFSTALRFIPLVLIAIAGVIAYSNTFQVPFLFDDYTSIVTNPLIISLDNFLSSSKGYDFSSNRFIGYLTFALNYKFGGADPTGYHIVNLAIHVLNGFLVYFWHC